MNPFLTFIGSFLILSVIFIVLQKGVHNSKSKKILMHLRSGNYEEAEAELNKASTKFFLSQFERESIRYNVYWMQQDNKKIEQQLDYMFTLKLNKFQKKSVLTLAFNYYVNKRNKKKSKKYLHEIKSYLDDSLIEHCQMMYDILISKQSNYIDVLKKQLLVGDNSDKSMTAYLIALQYENLKDTENQIKYQDLSKSYLENQ